MWSRKRPIVCRHCGGQSRLSDKALVAEALVGQFAAIPLLFAFFLLPWWGAALLVVATIAGISLLLDTIFPLVPLEEFGSAADIRRATIHFWLVAPIGLVVVVLICIALVRAIANAA